MIALCKALGYGYWIGAYPNTRHKMAIESIGPGYVRVWVYNPFNA